MKIIEIKQTCAACPTQFEAVTDRGKFLYMRFRYGRGYVKQFDSREGLNGDEFFSAPIIAEFAHGDSLLGVISLEEFLELADLELAEFAHVDLYPEEAFY